MSYIDQLLGQNERVVFTTHQHWMRLLPSFLVNLGLALLIMFVTAISVMMGSPLGPLPSVLVAVPVARFIYTLMLWRNEEYIVTNRRVIQVEGVVNKNVTDSSLEKVNDVKMSQTVLGRMFDYGDVEILTASELGANLFKRIMSPIKFKTAMLNQKEALGLGELSVATRPSAAADIPTLLTDLDQLRKQGVITEEEFQREKQELLEKL